jgi:hypothetical protein
MSVQEDVMFRPGQELLLHQTRNVGRCDTCQVQYRVWALHIFLLPRYNSLQFYSHVASLAGCRWVLDPPLADGPSGCCSVQVAAKPLGKASFKSGLAHKTIFVVKWSWLTRNMIQTKLCRGFGHPGEEIRTRDWCWSRVTAWMPILNIWRIIPRLLIFGRFINDSLRKFPRRGVPKHFQILYPQGSSISALHYLLQFEGCRKYTCLLDLSGRDMHLIISYDNLTSSFPVNF